MNGPSSGIKQSLAKYNINEKGMLSKRKTGGDNKDLFASNI